MVCIITPLPTFVSPTNSWKGRPRPISHCALDNRDLRGPNAEAVRCQAPRRGPSGDGGKRYRHRTSEPTKAAWCPQRPSSLPSQIYPGHAFVDSFIRFVRLSWINEHHLILLYDNLAVSNFVNVLDVGHIYHTFLLPYLTLLQSIDDIGSLFASMAPNGLEPSEESYTGYISAQIV